jgi:hypothetical protein
VLGRSRYIAGMLLVAMCAVGAAPARADETARLENVLLLEQLVDVGTTQAAVHSLQCTPYMPIVGAAGAPMLGAAHICLGGQEGDPLARPFVRTPLINTAAALTINAFVRLALHTRNPRALRYAVVIYPLAIGRTLTTEYTNVRAVWDIDTARHPVR